jgi:hypothetical protein
MKLHRSLLLASLVLAPLSARAADVPVIYEVDSVALKTAVTGTVLTFALHTDAACTSPVHAQATPIDDVRLVAVIKRFKPRGGLKPPKTAQIQTTLTGVTATGPLYLQVSGTGITPVGGACQAQSASSSGRSGIVLKDVNGTLLGPLDLASGIVTLSDGGTLIGAIPSPSGFFQGTSFYYESTDCTGTRLSFPGFVWVRNVVGVEGSTLYYSPASAPNLTANSSDYSPEIAGNCAGTGQLFVPPDRCCCTSPSCFTPFSGPLGPVSTLDVSAFLPPFHAEPQ